MNTAASPLVFDPTAVRRHVARARHNFSSHSALFDVCSAEIKERLGDVKRDFSYALDLSLFPFLAEHARVTIASDILFDEETLPFAPQSFDLIASNLALHWVNDVPGALTQIRALLRPEGLFIGSLIGGESLRELRGCLIDAELAVMGGVSPRLSPTINLQTAAMLMQRAGFSLPVVDKETVTLLYADMFALMHELRGMGQANAHAERLRTPTRRAIFSEAAHLYRKRFGDTDGRIPATFDIIHLHGWK